MKKLLIGLLVMGAAFSMHGMNEGNRRMLIDEYSSDNEDAQAVELQPVGEVIAYVVANQEEDYQFATQSDHLLAESFEMASDIELNEEPTALDLYDAIENGIKKDFDQMLQEGLNGGFDFVNQSDALERTPLRLAVEYDRRYMVGVLLQNGAYVNKPGSEGEMPLHFVRSLPVANALVARGARINAQTTDTGLTPLHCCNDMAIAQMLIYEGADCSLKDADGKTALEKNSDLKNLYDRMEETKALKRKWLREAR